MKLNEMKTLNMTVLSMFLVVGLYAPPTLADNGSTAFNVDAFFGHSGTPNYNYEHDSEWPTEEQPEYDVHSEPAVINEEENSHKELPTREESGSDVPGAPSMAIEEDEHYSEWPTEEQPHFSKTLRNAVLVAEHNQEDDDEEDWSTA